MLLSFVVSLPTGVFGNVKREGLMKTAFIFTAFFMIVLASAFCEGEPPVDNPALTPAETQTASVSEYDDENTGDSPATESVEKVRIADSGDQVEFEDNPQKPVYGPLGIVFRTVEYTLDKLYILFHW